MRHNLCTAPNGASTDRWSITGGTVAASGRGVLFTISTTGAQVGYWGFGAVNKYATAKQGDVWTISADVTHSASGTKTLYWTWMDSTGAQITYAQTTYSATAGAVQRVSFTSPVAPANTAFVAPAWRIDSGVIGDTLHVENVLVEKASQPLAYFDGDTINSVWDGTAGASSSSCRSLASTAFRRNLHTNPSWRTTSGTTTVRSNLCTNPSFETGIANWSTAASYWTNTGAVLTQDNTWSDSAVAQSVYSGKVVCDGTVNQQGITFSFTGVANTTYTVTAVVKNDSGRPVAVKVRDTTNAVNAQSGTVAAGATATLSATITTGATASPAMLVGIATDTTAGATTFHVDSVLIEVASVNLGYFDGATLPTAGLTASWSSGANASISNLIGISFTTAPIVGWAALSKYWQSDPAGVMRVLLRQSLGAGGILAFGGQVNPAVVPGAWVKGRVQVRAVGATADVKLRPRIGFYTSGGGFTGSFAADSGVDILVPASGAWVDLVVPASVAAPSSTAAARWLVYVGTGYTLPGGAVYEFRDALMEQASGAGEGAGVYFDGNTAGGIWDGAVDASTSQALSLAAPIPTMPVVGVKVWTDENPPASVTGTTTKPLVLGDRAVSLKTGRGRQYELDQDQAGTCEVVAVNDDGGITGDAASGRIPMRQYRLEATWDGTTYPLFTGYVSAWPDQQQDPATGRATVVGVDLFEALAQREMTSVVQETIQAVSVGPPDFYYRLSDDAKAVGGGNAGVVTGLSYPTAPLVDFKLGTASLAFGATAFLNNSSETCLGYSNTTANRARQMQISGPQNTSGPSIDTTQPWMVSVFLDATAGNSSVFNILDKQGNLFAYISFDTTVGGGQITVYAGGNGMTWGGVNGYLDTSKTGGGFHAVVGYDGTHGIGYILGGNATTWTYTPKGTLSWIAAGPAFNSSAIFGSSQGTFRISHLAIWTGTIPVAQDVSDINSAGYWSWNADAPESRIVRLLKWAGHTAITYETDDLPLANMPDTKGSSAIDVLRASALSTLSRFFMGADGSARLWYRHHGQTFMTPKWTFGGNTAAGELPYEGSPQWDYDTTHIYNDVQVNRAGGAQQRAINSTSAGKFFTRPLQVETALYYDTAAQQMAQWLAGQYGDPVERIQELTLHPSAYPALWPAVLGMELGDIVQVNHPSLSGVRSALYQVAHIAHEVDAKAGEWFTTLQLTPFSQEWVLGAMHTTLTAFVAAGATSISLNPLPDSATNPAEASLAVGTTIMLDPASPYRETVTITSVASVPTAHTTGYTSITVGVTATAHAHAAGSVACDPLPTGETDPTAWDSRSVLESTTIVSF